MKKYLLYSNEFFDSYYIIENHRPIAIVKVSKEKIPYEVDMVEKAPSYLIAVFDYLRAEWRTLWNSILD